MRIFDRKNKDLLKYFLVTSFIFMAQGSYCSPSADLDTEQNEVTTSKSEEDESEVDTVEEIVNTLTPNATNVTKLSFVDKGRMYLGKFCNGTKWIGGEISNYTKTYLTRENAEWVKEEAINHTKSIALKIYEHPMEVTVAVGIIIIYSSIKGLTRAINANNKVFDEKIASLTGNLIEGLNNNSNSLNSLKEAIGALKK